MNIEYRIENDNKLYIVKELEEYVMKQFVGLSKRIIAECNNSTISVGQITNIVFKHYIFNTITADYVVDNNNIDKIHVYIGGNQLDVEPGEVIEFSSFEPGKYVIASTNEGAKNAELEVTVYG
ncbi:hypothetical protein [Desulforamulus aquiferis]|uniref:Uncharacterized protein n=1 Tax=Desulforamulus aquiferis TaxID=1397668 RepID=A0AAW7ZDJ2_9FIRM|nr:hypothetical protein [Desulforamulus aquiferis]MDO7787503.1 hypothetical protein [Desulforamulus aquiferis]